MIKERYSGFTIVELLIVIVVIAILASISIVAYTGIQARAQNTMTISAARDSIKLMQMYKSLNGAYPSSYWLVCFGEYDDDVCMYFNGTNYDVEASESSTFKAAIATIGTMPKPSKEKFQLLHGRYGGGVMYFGGVNPPEIRYYLKGQNQVCSAGGVASNESAATRCLVTLP